MVSLRAFIRASNVNVCFVENLTKKRRILQIVKLQDFSDAKKLKKLLTAVTEYAIVSVKENSSIRISYLSFMRDDT